MPPKVLGSVNQECFKRPGHTTLFPSLNASPTTLFPSLNAGPTTLFPSLNAGPTTLFPSLNFLLHAIRTQQI